MCGQFIYFFFFFFFFATSRKTSSQQTAKDFCLVKYLRYAGRPPPASAPRFGLTAVNTSLRCGRQSSPHPLATEGTQNGHKKKHHAPARWELECAQQPKKQSSAGQPITPCLQKKKKKRLFSALSSWHALLSYAYPPCLYSSCWMHVKVKTFSTFQRDVVLQRSSMSLLAQAISARCPRSTSGREKGGRNRQNVLQYLWEGEQEKQALVC